MSPAKHLALHPHASSAAHVFQNVVHRSRRQIWSLPAGAAVCHPFYWALRACAWSHRAGQYPESRTTHDSPRHSSTIKFTRRSYRAAGIPRRSATKRSDRLSNPC